MRSYAFALLLALSALSGTPRLSHAVVIPVTYNNNVSWIAEGVPIAISNGPDGHPAANGQSIQNPRIHGQTFTTAQGFTLDKIWLKYFEANAAPENFMLEIRLFEVSDPTAADLPDTMTNLFSEPQIHQGARPVYNNIVENYVIFDVENIDLKPATAYGFFLYLTTSSSSAFYRWTAFNTATSDFDGGTHHRLERSGSASTFDMVFALQYLPQQQQDPQDPPPAIETPEPATGLLTGLGLGLIARRRRPTR